ncbi:farnesol dehydrogenase-like [Photinus pyralis]|uniref:Dehydrogenase n=1 Tax=Photinus pyralis TaxID=7054 RepID=A0A1Y1N9P5_PHOPY|nr:farnesol dehydrogenase-like [Photinus pyralis]
MERWKGKVAVVTGVSSGIGESLAIQLVEAGLKVVGLARRKDRGEELGKRLKGKEGEFHFIQADISKEEDVLSAYAWIEKNLGAVHILVNNAGVALQTSLVDGDFSVWKQNLDTNVLGLCAMTREAIKSMKKNNVDGHIVHVNSLSGHRVLFHSNLNVYAASKYAVTALTETLRQELISLGSKIKISSVSPGMVYTEMVSDRPIDGLVAPDASGHSLLEPKDVADTIVFVLATPPHIQIHDIQMRARGQIP